MSDPNQSAYRLQFIYRLGGNKKFKCPECGWTADRDSNGARNIMIRALQATAFTITGDDVPSLTLVTSGRHRICILRCGLLNFTIERSCIALI